MFLAVLHFHPTLTSLFFTHLSFPPSGGSEIHDAAFGYFITACVVIMLSILSYVLLPKLVKRTRTSAHTHMLISRSSNNTETKRMIFVGLESFYFEESAVFPDCQTKDYEKGLHCLLIGCQRQWLDRWRGWGQITPMVKMMAKRRGQVSHPWGTGQSTGL